MFQAQRIKASWVGPQQREFQQEIPQAKQVGVGPNRENFNKKFYKQGRPSTERKETSIVRLYYELQ